MATLHKKACYFFCFLDFYCAIVLYVQLLLEKKIKCYKEQTSNFVKESFFVEK